MSKGANLRIRNVGIRRRKFKEGKREMNFKYLTKSQHLLPAFNSVLVGNRSYIYDLFILN